MCLSGPARFDRLRAIGCMGSADGRPPEQSVLECGRAALCPPDVGVFAVGYVVLGSRARRRQFAAVAGFFISTAEVSTP